MNIRKQFKIKNYKQEYYKNNNHNKKYTLNVRS